MIDDRPLLSDNDISDEMLSEERPTIPRRTRTNSTIVAALGLVLLVNLSTSLYQLPVNRVIERRLCRDHFAEHDPSKIRADGSVDEDLCKLPSVESGLARIQGLIETTWIIGDFVMTIPLGFAAERYGRRSILWLNLVPRVFMLTWAVIVGYFDHSLPTKAIIFGSMLSFLGGDCVFNSITYALVASSTQDNVQRATYFGYMSSISYIVALLGPALASATMSVLLWLPFWIGICLLLLAIPTISSLPSEPSSPGSRAYEEFPSLLQSTRGDRDSDLTLFLGTKRRLRAFCSFLVSHPRNFGLLLATFFLTSLASSDTKLLAQYISIRYRWTFASAGYLLSGKAIVNFLLLAIVLPHLLRSRRPRAVHGERHARSGDQTNIRYANVCLGLSALGAFAIALSARISLLIPSLLLYALGSALPVFTLSLLKSPSMSSTLNGGREVDAVSVETHVFSVVMLIKTLGSLVGAPLMATLLMYGISVGGAALGIPYFVSSFCYVLAIAVLAGIKIRR